MVFCGVQADIFKQLILSKNRDEQVRDELILDDSIHHPVDYLNRSQMSLSFTLEETVAGDPPSSHGLHLHNGLDS